MPFLRRPVRLLAAMAGWQSGSRVWPISFRSRSRALISNDVKEYPNAGHAFMNRHGTFLFKLLRYKAIGYNEPAALDAHRRIAAFFHRHLDR